MIFPTKQTFHYIEQLYVERGLNKNDYTNITHPFSGGDVIDDDVARFFRLLLMMKQPMHILEIGTSIGFSTVTMAKIIQTYGGKITTIELDKKTVQKAKENFVRYNVAEHIEIIQGDAKKVMHSITGLFDYIFMDVGDKSLYKELLNECVDKLTPGGILVAEDSLYGSLKQKENFKSFEFEYQEMIEVLNEFNCLVASHPHIESTLLPIGDGVTLAIKNYDKLVE